MNQDQKSRAGGFLLIVSGAVLGYLAIWRPYQEALRGAPAVSLHRSGIGLAIIFPIMGVILAAFGETVNAHVKIHFGATKTKRGWAYVIAIAAIALATYIIVKAKFEALGYTL